MATDQHGTDLAGQEGRRARQSWALVVAAAISAAALVALNRWFAGGIVIGALVLMLAIENTRRSWTLGSAIRFGAAIGLLAGWLVVRFVLHSKLAE